MATPTRRSFLAAAGLTAAAAGLTGVAGCSALQSPSSAPVTPRLPGAQVDDVRGAFRWTRCAGTEINVLLTAHNYTTALLDDIRDFERLTGMRIRTTVLPEGTYFDRVTTELVSGSSQFDAFMIGAYMVWQYGPPGWLEDLDPWLANRSATSADYDVDDILPNLQDALRWDFVLGHRLGRGRRWAMPWGWEANVIAYNAPLLRELKVDPPTTLGELDAVARSAAELQSRRRFAGRHGYGIAVRGTDSWATVHPGFMTQYTREGNADFHFVGGQIAPAIDTAGSRSFHRRWTSMIKEAGSPEWPDATYQICADDLASGRAAMMYDATSVTVAKDRPGASRLAGDFAWHPGPSGPDGNLRTNLWVWSLAMNSRSIRKPAAWLFIQWATGRGHLGRAALNNHNDPVRASIIQSPRYRAVMSKHRDYLDTIDAVRKSTYVAFTPQPAFFNATTSWATALRQMHAGHDVDRTLADLDNDLRLHG